MAGRVLRTSFVAAVAVGLSSGVAPAATVKVTHGRAAPGGFAQITVKAHPKPKALVLSKDRRFGASDLVIGLRAGKAKRGRLGAWIALPTGAAPGSYTVLGCRKAKPSAASC